MPLYNIILLCLDLLFIAGFLAFAIVSLVEGQRQAHLKHLVPDNAFRINPGLARFAAREFHARVGLILEPDLIMALRPPAA